MFNRYRWGSLGCSSCRLLLSPCRSMDPNSISPRGNVCRHENQWVGCLGLHLPHHHKADLVSKSRIAGTSVVLCIWCIYSLLLQLQLHLSSFAIATAAFLPLTANPFFPLQPFLAAYKVSCSCGKEVLHQPQFLKVKCIFSPKVVVKF